jgi:hypothetical protein
MALRNRSTDALALAWMTAAVAWGGNLLGAIPAFADDALVPVTPATGLFGFSYSGPGVAATGELFITPGVTQGQYPVTNVTGSANGATITGLNSTYGAPNNILYYPASTTTITGIEKPPTFVSLAGISFNTSNGDAWNLANTSPQGTIVLDKFTNPKGLSPNFPGGAVAVKLDNVTLAPIGTVQFFTSGSSTFGGNPTAIVGGFFPPLGKTLTDVFNQLGVVGLNWKQTVDTPAPPPPAASSSAPPIQIGTDGQYHFADPIPGGWRYTGGVNSYPFYYDPSPSNTGNFALANHSAGGKYCAGANELCFFDSPSNWYFKFFDGHSSFTTDLVGMVPCGAKAATECTPEGYTDGPILYEIKWTSNYAAFRLQVDGTLVQDFLGSGGITVAQAYPGEFIDQDGTGGISVSSFGAPVLSVPGPIVGAGLPGLLMALGGLIAWRRRRMVAA